MKIFFVLILALISMQSQALPTPPVFSGHFKFTGKLNVVNTFKKEIVYVINEDGRARLEQLKKLSYTCWPVLSTTYSCTKNTNDLLPQEVEIKLRHELVKDSIEISEPISDWGLISVADYLTEFAMFQKSIMGGSVFNKSRYLITPDIQKFVLQADNNDSVWFNVYDGRLFMAVEARKTTGKNTFESYLIEALFERD